jgi:hypothetical protein
MLSTSLFRRCRCCHCWWLVVASTWRLSPTHTRSVLSPCPCLRFHVVFPSLQEQSLVARYGLAESDLQLFEKQTNGNSTVSPVRSWIQEKPGFDAIAVISVRSIWDCYVLLLTQCFAAGRSHKTAGSGFSLPRACHGEKSLASCDLGLFALFI